ncbi:MAG: diguanylate cyclase [Syntrophorhabdaceae bacterium]|nr:diguanylate cyclase [Syntrophorhabdaceae bacterium]
MNSIDRFTQLIFNVYEAFTVAVYIRDQKHLKCISSVTFSRGFDKNRLLSIEGTLPGWVIKHSQPLIIPNFDKDESALGYYSSAEEIKSFMGYPMGTEGVIVVDSKKKWVFTDKEKRILSGFAAAILEEIEKERKYLEAEEKIEELNSEKRIFTLFNYLLSSRISVKDILKECVHISGGDICFVGIEQNENMVIHELLGASEQNYLNKMCFKKNCISAMVLDGGRELLLPFDSGFFKEKPLFFYEESIKARQFFGFPLITDDIPFGVLGIVSLSNNRLKEKAINILRDISMFLSLYYSSFLTKKAYDRVKNYEPVTGALFFSKFLKMLEEEIKKEKRLSVVSIRLKIVESFNKTIGIYNTDMFLKKVFNMIRQCLGNNAIITRKNGGHFYALIGIHDRSGTKNAIKVLNKIVYKNVSEEKRFDMDNIIESGIAFFPEDSKDLWELLSIADNTKI